MIKEILIPLDGSDAAEISIPFASQIATGFGGNITLFHSCVPEYKLARNMHKLYIERRAEVLKEQLQTHKGEEAIDVKPVFIEGEFKKVITEYVTLHEVDLVVMADHGFTRISLKPVGHVANEVFRLLKSPALLIRSKLSLSEAEKSECLIRRMLVPIDGSANSERALPIAIQISKELGVTLHLYMVIDDESKRRTKSKYLDKVVKDLRAQGIEANYDMSIGTDRARLIHEASILINSDLIVMATQGRSMPKTWSHGSVAHTLLNIGSKNILIV
jgi:nucleotide-binding universal stress UspA family protein